MNIFLNIAAQNCTDGTVRLVDGPLKNAGRVEICINGVWGTVCGFGWNRNDAEVVCRQLGYIDTGGNYSFRNKSDKNGLCSYESNNCVYPPVYSIYFMFVYNGTPL